MAANEYDNSWLLDVYTYSDHPNVKKVVEELYEKLMQVPIYEKVPSKKKVREHIKLIVLNLYDAYLYDPTMYIAYSMNENDYKHGRYNELHIGYEYLKTIIDHLKNLDYLFWKNGWIDHKTRKSRYSRIQAKTKLMEKIVMCEVTQDMVYEHPNREELEEIIILRASYEKKKKRKSQLITKKALQLPRCVKTLKRLTENYEILL